MKPKNILFIIDPQNDFCNPQGALYVPGADEDMKRLASFVSKHMYDLDDIVVSLDDHLPIHIAHPCMWVNATGKHPDPFTVVTSDDIRQEVYKTTEPIMHHDPVTGAKQTWAQFYTEALEAAGKSPLCIWPEHCIIGSNGASVHSMLLASINAWQRERMGLATYIRKGANIRTEHYSVFRAEVEDPTDRNTQMNDDLMNVFRDPLIQNIYVAGEALGHCVKNTLRDMFDELPENVIRKVTLLKDCTSCVPGSEETSKEFIEDASCRGVRVIETTEIEQ